MRRLQVHDGVHVLLGYSTSPLGEAKVQAFLLGSQFHINHVVLLIVFRTRLISEGYSFGQIGAELLNAYRLGRKSQFNLDAWQPEQQWEKPLLQLRNELLPKELVMG